MLGRLIFFTVIVFIFLNTDQSEASQYITKKSDTSKIVAKIEKEYSDGKITKSECTKKKSKALKLGKVSKTICDNVEVKTVKEETKEKKKVEYIKKKEKKKKKAKKEFLKKTKDLSKKAKSWITKKVKKEKKHYKTIAQLPKSDFYFAATDDKGNNFIGYMKSDQSSEIIEIGNKKFKKFSNGMAFLDDGKTQCNLSSEMDEVSKYTKINYFTGKVFVRCPNRVLIGIWHQTGNEGSGMGKFDDGVELDFTFLKNRNDAIALLKKIKKESRKTKKIVKIEEKNYETKDSTKPVITVFYNQDKFVSSKDKKANLEFDKKNYVIEGVVTDKGGSLDKVVLRLDRKPITVNENGSFLIKHTSNKNEEIWLTAWDGAGNVTDFLLDVTVSSIASKFINNKKYYALIIGNSDYDKWDDLVSPANDTKEIAKVLKEKYKFEITLLQDSTKDEIENALWDLNDKITEEDYLLIYYAGHGSKDIAIQKAYWIPTDAKAIDKPGRYWLSTSIITEHVGRMKARHVLLMVDSCYSGITIKGDDNIKADVERDLENPLYFKKMLNRKARLFISSGGDAPVPDTADGKHSLFAKKFIEVLKLNNSSIDSEEVFIKVKKYVQNNSSDNPKYRPIKDIGHNEGVFVFSAKN